MTTPEGKLKNRVKELLKKYGVCYHMPLQNGMGSPTLDFICCHKGVYVAIETKAPGNKPTARQLLTIDKIQRAGGIAFCITSTEPLEVWLKMVENCPPVNLQ